MIERTLPRLLVLTDRHASEARGRSLETTVDLAVAGGARGVVLREKDLPLGARAEIGRVIRAHLDRVDGFLLVASDVELARDVDADGVHLAADDPWPRANGLLIARSCHDAAELDAARERAHYVTLSPIFDTSSKPGYGPALGVAALAGNGGPGMPKLFALGGVDPSRARSCIAAGADGVAVMGSVMRADQPGDVVGRFVTEIG